MPRKKTRFNKEGRDFIIKDVKLRVVDDGDEMVLENLMKHDHDTMQKRKTQLCKNKAKCCIKRKSLRVDKIGF